jgi:hypothetical protein
VSQKLILLVKWPISNRDILALVQLSEQDASGTNFSSRRPKALGVTIVLTV